MVSGDVGAQKPEGGDSFHTFSVHEEGGWSCLFFLKSRMSSVVFLTFRVRLSSEHQSDSVSTSALDAVSSSPLMSPTTVVGWVGEQV